MVKAFYTAGHLFDVLTIFGDGELDEKIAENRKYAKWKAAYIHNCLKNGQVPLPGPMEDAEERAPTDSDAHFRQGFARCSAPLSFSSPLYVPLLKWAPM